MKILEKVTTVLYYIRGIVVIVLITIVLYGSPPPVSGRNVRRTQYSVPLYVQYKHQYYSMATADRVLYKCSTFVVYSYR